MWRTAALTSSSWPTPDECLQLSKVLVVEFTLPSVVSFLGFIFPPFLYHVIRGRTKDLVNKEMDPNEYTSTVT